MKRHIAIAVLILTIVTTPLLITGCATTSSRAAATQAPLNGQRTFDLLMTQALLNGQRTFDLLMTLIGNSYQAGAFGPRGSQQAENIKSTAERVSKIVGAASEAAIAAIEQKRDPAAYLSDIAKALAELQALLPASKHGALELLRPTWARMPRLGRPDIYFTRFGGAS
jgi:hypothetical protein